MGFLSRFDQKLADMTPGTLKDIGENVDPGRSDLGKAMAIGDPLGIPMLGVASGNLGPFGTPTEKGVDNPYAVSGITDVAHDKGAEIAALMALGSWIGGGASGLFADSGDAAAGAGAGAGDGAYVGDLAVDPSAGSYLEGGNYVGDLATDSAIAGDNVVLADAGTTATDVGPGLVAEPVDTTPASGLVYPGETTESGAAGGPATGGGGGATKTGGNTSWLKSASRYGVPLGLLGLSTAMSSKKQEMPNKAQYQELSAEAQALAKQLLDQYRSGTLSPAQQAQLDQLTQQTKNQINNYYASIGQSGSTSHQQALAKADTDALAVKANMLQTTLNQGMQAIGLAQGPLNAMATYQMQQDKRLQDAYANFARSAAYLYGANSGGKNDG